MRKVKVNELSGLDLDRFVSKALWGNCRVVNGDNIGVIGTQYAYRSFNPSLNWADGGPIIERERITITPYYGSDLWCAGMNVPTGGDDYTELEESGSTPLEAGMRCFVHSKFGDEVEMSE